MKIIFATQTGNSEELAEDLGKELNASPINLADIDLDDIKNETCLFLVSTWGEGEPPDDGERFLDELNNNNEQLSNINYSIFGLGDTSYEIFCGFAKELDSLFKKFNAKNIIENVYCNVDYEQDYEVWKEKVLNFFNNSTPSNSEANNGECIEDLINDLSIINNRVKHWEWRWPNIQLEALIRALEKKK